MDFNGDGIKDLLYTYYDGAVVYYTRKADGSLHKEKNLVCNGSPITYGPVGTLAVLDFNGDGLFDLVMSNKGVWTNDWTRLPIRMYINKGTAQNYLFTGYDSLEVEGSKKGIHPYSHIYFTDLDGDGKKDLLYAGRGISVDPYYTLYFYRNTGTDNAPVYAKRDTVTSNGVRIYGYFGPFITAADWNNDGVKDLVLSSMDTLSHIFIYLAKKTTPIANGTSNPANAQYAFSYSKPLDRKSLMLKTDCPDHWSVSFYTISGKLIMSKNFQGPHAVVPLAVLPEGVYCVKFAVGNKILKFDRVLVNR